MTNKHAEKIEDEKFKKIKLEQLYLTTYQVKTDYSELTSAAIVRDMGSYLNKAGGYGLAPLSQLEMLISLYFPQIKKLESYTELMSTKDKLSKQISQIMNRDAPAFGTENGKAFNREIFKNFEEINENIEIFRKI
ncbi:hypothetical protein ACQUW5_08840 [Legionella sp. CNM-1927-20]|uniref:hypothetical protein n=1 Tax=Legionella sp. CNM-1927-20 TaxID=3422221 RepID=UPI00403ABB37